MVDKKVVTKFLVLFLIALLVIASFLVLKPIMIPIFLGALLAYILNPLYKKIEPLFKNKSAWHNIPQQDHANLHGFRIGHRRRSRHR